MKLLVFTSILHRSFGRVDKCETKRENRFLTARFGDNQPRGKTSENIYAVFRISKMGGRQLCSYKVN